MRKTVIGAIISMLVCILSVIAMMFTHDHDKVAIYYLFIVLGGFGAILSVVIDVSRRKQNQPIDQNE